MSKNFIIKGRAKIGIKWEKFEKSVSAPGKERALDAALSTMGGSHGIKRNQIRIESVEEAPVAEQ
jgi:large subunit ribosomal protein LX